MSHEPARISLTTVDGVRLVGEQQVPAPAIAAAAIAHPHPQYGGTMHDAVVETLWRVLGDAGVATVRFAFRGTGGSDGTHGGGDPERLDMLAALGHAASLAPGSPLLACGYSFGADVALTCDNPAVNAWIAIAPPLALFDASTIVAASDSRPAHLFVAAHDQFAPPDVVRQRVATWPSATVHVVDLVDHFFRGGYDRLRQAIQSVLPTITR